MIRTTLWLLNAAFWLIVLLPLALIGMITGKGPQCTGFGVRLAKCSVLGIAGFHCEVFGKEHLPEGPVLYTPNHQGMWDVAAMLCYFGGMKGFVAKAGIHKVPIVNLWLNNLRCVYIDRDSAKKSLLAIQKAQENLESGYSMVVFPEGTRSKGPQLGEFKTGALRCALKSGVPIVPVAIDGTYHAYEEKGHIAPAQVKISILPPIPTAGLKLKSAEVSKQIREQIDQELQRLRRM